MHAWGGQDGYRKKLTGGKMGRRMYLGGVNKSRKDHGFGFLNSSLEYLEGRMRFKRLWKLIPQA